MMKIDLSIIVPVYNSERYLKKCIKSILNQQSNLNYEIILINDGSEDKSLELCYDFKKKYDDKIVVISCSNHGVSHARNLGIKASRGDYLSFIDADDFVTSNYLQVIDTYILKKAELLIFSHNVIQNKKTVKQICQYEKKCLKSDFLDDFWFYYENSIFHSVWNKIYLREIIVDNNVFFNEDFSIGEDLLFNCCYLGYINNIFLTKNIIYNYVINFGSAMHSFREDDFNNSLLLLAEIEKFAKNNNIYNDEFLENIIFHKMNSLLNSVQNLFTEGCTLSIKNKKRIIVEMLKKINIKSYNVKVYGNVKKTLLFFLKYNMINISIIFCMIHSFFRDIINIRK